MEEKSNGPYRDARPQGPPNPITEAAAALAHRLRIAAGTPWDGVRCDTEAAGFMDQLTRRGWRPPRPQPEVAPWQERRSVDGRPDGVEACRAALAEAREAQAIRDAEIAAIKASFEVAEPEETA